jgi:TRAP-type mannitol/chloroaromatic compound transport system permease small subunit
MDPKKDEPPSICKRIEAFITSMGKAVCWLNVVLAGVIIVQVTLRYVFRINFVALEEFQWYLYGVLIMLGLSFGVTTDRHIRLDLLHRNFSGRRKEMVEALGILFLLLPMAMIVFIHGLDFTASSYRVNEASDSPLGLPYRWLFKAVIPLSMFLLSASALSRLIRATAFLFAGRKAEKGNAH